MAWLALVAVLLMSAMPMVSRVLATTAQAGPILMEMCTTAGRQLIDVSPFIPAAEQSVQPPTVMSDACGYCMLATPLPLVLLVLGLLGLVPTRPPVVRYYRLFLPLPRNLRGLGSQAPPRAL
jgi:hypothetical protein